MEIEPVRIGIKELRLHKAVRSAEFQLRNVLTADPFAYVDLWLRRQHHQDALFYWRQAQSFYRASRDLPIEASPLVLYYCFMNAAKALLSSKAVNFNPHHGVRAHLMRGSNSKVMLSNEGIRILQSGIVPALSGYFGELEASPTHSLEDVLYNLVFIHRTYCLSFPRASERFLPLKDAGYVRDRGTGKVWFQALPVSDVDWRSVKRHLPPEVEASVDGSVKIVSLGSITLQANGSPMEAELDALRGLNATVRRSVHYINGAQTLWYLKLRRARAIERQSITLTLAAMHRLSEICRYRPSELESFLNGQKNWLLSEFIVTAPAQFLDEVACEMTGHQVMIPNVRTPT